MLNLKIQQIKKCTIFIPVNKNKKTTIPTKVGIHKLYKYFLVNYYTIILLQKYGFNISKGLRKVFLTKILN